MSWSWFSKQIHDTYIFSSFFLPYLCQIFYSFPQLLDPFPSSNFTIIFTFCFFIFSVFPSLFFYSTFIFTNFIILFTFYFLNFFCFLYCSFILPLSSQILCFSYFLFFPFCIFGYELHLPLPLSLLRLSKNLPLT